jgi:threonine dehydrogenase-like Zn-dependent dehydrogenase
MKALQIQAPGKAAMIEIEDPTPGPNQVLVRVEAVVSCPQWDLTMMSGRDIIDRPGHPHYPAFPGRPGHEMSGAIESIGPGVEDFAQGDPVVVWRVMGIGDNDICYYAEKACVPTAALMRRPANLSAAQAASLEMAMCVASCFLTLPRLCSQRVSVGGLGPAGLIAVQMARAAGAALVVGFDLNPERREMACTLGADESLDPRSGEAARYTDLSKVDYAIDCSGNHESVEFQMDIATQGVALFGVPHHPYTFAPRHWSLTLYGYKGHTLAAANYAMGLLRTGALRLDVLNSVELPLNRFAEGTELLAQQRALKILYRP